MSEIVQCDWCGKTTQDRYGTLGWLKIDDYSIVISSDFTKIPQHFCSFGCVALWASKYRDLVEHPTRPK